MNILLNDKTNNLIDTNNSALFIYSNMLYLVLRARDIPITTGSGILLFINNILLCRCDLSGDYCIVYTVLLKLTKLYLKIYINALGSYELRSYYCMYGVK